MGRRIVIGAWIYTIALAGCSDRTDAEQCTSPPPPADPAKLCAFDAPLSFVVDAEFSTDEVAAIERALGSWRDATGGRFDGAVRGRPSHADAVAGRFAPATATALVRVAHDGDPALLAHVDELAGGYAGRAIALDKRIYVLVDRIETVARTELIVLHELGHAWGLEHVPGVDAVMVSTVDAMNPCVRATPRPTARDLEEVRAKRCR